jgi:hypothetical protein
MHITNNLINILLLIKFIIHEIKMLSLFKFEKSFYFEQIRYLNYLEYIMRFVSLIMKYPKNITN